MEVDCTVWRPMNSHGGVTLWETAGHRTFHVVEYARPSIRTAMARATGTTALRVRLVPLNSRGETWRAVGVTPNP
ncbi:hypothetical protein EGH24_11850 [Halonotius terrestris]|uniref:DUF7999 domain-containing protein n=1 Tax=Halonotius terrestris TaxID=2487750 RepID=A0A8J8TBS4_9EURY|nr:hypothetical protein [Halonotius terrestris]TQQ79317.1 hypothetical protein EGH24_11850 [Halonotius terrestris]